MDGVGTNIRLDSRGSRQVMRALPRVNEDVNEEWAHDKTRHHVDGLVRNRLDRVWVRREGAMQPSNWTDAFALIARTLRDAPGSVAASQVEEQPPPRDEDVLEETPDFLQETPEHDRLWFEQKPPRDFDFDN